MNGRRLLALVAALGACAPAAAHTRSQSFSSWDVDGATVIGVYQVAAYRATQLGENADDGVEALLASHLARTVSVSQAGVACVAGTPRPLPAARGDVRVELTYACPESLAAVPATVTLGAFFEVSPSHVHYARVARAGGQAREVLATVRSHAFDAGGTAATGPTDLAAFFRLGMEHVLSGLDHLAFLAALALLAGGLGRAAWAATGFTLGHSLTLGLVATGWLNPDVRSIEALIGFTVAFAAGEAYASRAGSAPRVGWITLGLVAAVPLLAKLAGASLLPWAVAAGTLVFALCAGGLGGAASRRIAPLLAAAFGLAHGAGFAGPLLELDIPRDRLLAALVGFNLGVEAAQLLALVVVAAIAAAAARLPPLARKLTLDWTTACLYALGVYWFVERSLTLA